MFDGQDDHKHKGAKQAVDANAGFSRRQGQNISIRAKAREGALEKKRRQAGADEPDVGDSGVNGDPMNPWSYDRNTPPGRVPLALLPQFVQLAHSQDEREVFQGVLMIRKLLAVERDAPLQEVIDTGVAPILVQCMSHPNHDLQFEASWALSNIASGNVTQANYVMSLNTVPLWIQHLSSPNLNCLEQATWALGNIAGEGAKCRNYVLETGAMTPLLTLIQNCTNETLSLLQSAVWALSNLCRFKPPPAIEHVSPAVPILVQMIQHPDIEIALDSVWALSYICDGPTERVQLVIDSGVVPLIVKMLTSELTKFHMPAIRILGNICAGIDKQTQVAINAGCLPPIAGLLHPSRVRGVRKEAAWTLSNIGAGTQQQIQAIIQAGLIPILVSTISAYEAEVKKEAVWACANIATNGSSQQISFLVECHVLEALCEVLNTSSDAKILTVALEAIMTILENGDELVKLGHYPVNPYSTHIRSFQGDVNIEAHISHSNPDLRSLVGDIMQLFFDHDAVPVASANTQEVLGSGEFEDSNGAGSGSQFWNNTVPQGGFNF